MKRFDREKSEDEDSVDKNPLIRDYVREKGKRKNRRERDMEKKRERDKRDRRF
jgi:hypothetical protein